jgi:S1-C subfamily serine protease
VCDGDVKVGANAINCFIIARGNVTYAIKASDSWIISSGSVRLSLADVDKTAKGKEKERTPLGFVKFFDPASIGVAVESADGVLRVKTVAAAKSFGRAGLRLGDQIIALDDTKVDSPESFRRALRTKLALADKLVVKVRRADRVLEIAVTCKD